MSEGVNDQKKRLSEALLKIAPNVTAQDRNEYAEEFQATKVTIVNYLKGRIRSRDTAARMLKFFTEKIQEREKIIQDAEAAGNQYNG